MGSPRGIVASHWKCRCSVLNHKTRKACLGCGNPKPKSYQYRKETEMIPDWSEIN
jgi:hypothetical protein